MAVEALAHVLLDPERLAAGDDPPADHQGGLDTPDRHDRRDHPGEGVRAALRLDPVDRLADEQHDRDRRRLREDGEDRRDDQRALVRAQEAEQADEGAAVRDRARRHGRAHVSEPSRASSRFTCVTALPRRARFAGSFSQPLAPEGCGSGITIASPSCAAVALADRLGQSRDAEQPPQRQSADGDDQVGSQQLELPVAPELAEVLLARRRRPVAAAGRRDGRGSSASPRRSRTSRRARRPRARASRAAAGRRGRATAAAPRPRRSRAPGRRGTRAGRGRAPAPARTRAGSRPRRRPGSARCRAGARRASGTSSCGASRADGDEPAAGEERLAAAELVERARPG